MYIGPCFYITDDAFSAEKASFVYKNIPLYSCHVAINNKGYFILNVTIA